MDTRTRITTVDTIPDAGSFIFSVRTRDGTETEAILVRTGTTIVCWLNRCRHYTHIRLDKGSGATIRDGEILCTNHGAMFNIETGYCTHGPCEGSYLQPIDVQVVDQTVYLTDPDYEFLAPGPRKRDEFDLASRSNHEF